MIQTLFVTSVFKLKINENLRSGIEFYDGIKLTNDFEFISQLITKDLKNAIGELEFNCLTGKADCVFYSIKEVNVNANNVDRLLCDFMANCKIFLNDLWLIKDNCADLMMGYVEFPYFKPSFILTPITTTPTIHSNCLNGGYTLADGKYETKVEYSIEELHDGINLFKNDNITRIPFHESSQLNTFHKNNFSRISLSHILTKTARVQTDLVIKVSQYSNALEALFSSESSELTHRLAERISFFLESEFTKRIELYNQVKTIYSIRSIAAHGLLINKQKLKELESISINADNLLRRLFIKIHNEKELDYLFRKRTNDNNRLMNEYFQKLIFNS